MSPMVDGKHEEKLLHDPHITTQQIRIQLKIIYINLFLKSAFPFLRFIQSITFISLICVKMPLGGSKLTVL